MLCQTISDAGFFYGLFSGLVAMFSIVGEVFSWTTVYDHCQNSWGYDFGFLLGLFLLFRLFVKMSWFILFVLFLAWVVIVVFKIFVVVFIVALAAICAYAAYQWVQNKISVF